MSDDQHGEGTPRGGSRWDPLPQGEYDDGATAFVELPEGGVDALLAADSPLAAPGHGYVPPQITVDPATTAGTDPAAPGTWPVPGAPVDGAQWHDPHAAHQQPGHDTGRSYGSQAYGSGTPYGSDAGAARHGEDDRFMYNPGATGQWNFEDASAAESAPGHDVTGQWSIPVAGGDLPDESGEFTTSSLVEQWGGTPPPTLPGGAPAPWATQAAGRPWGQQAPQDTAGQEQAGPGHPHGHEQGGGHGHGQPPAAGPASGYAPDPASQRAHAPEQPPAGPMPQEADPAVGHVPRQESAGQAPESSGFAGHGPESPGFGGHGPEMPGTGHAPQPPDGADDGQEQPAFAGHGPESYGVPGHGSDPHGFTDHGSGPHGGSDHGPDPHDVPGRGPEPHEVPGHGPDRHGFTNHRPEPSALTDHESDPQGFTDHESDPQAFTDHGSDQSAFSDHGSGPHGGSEHGPDPHDVPGRGPEPYDVPGHEPDRHGFTDHGSDQSAFTGHGPEPHAFTDHHGPEPHAFTDHHGPEPSGSPGHAPEPSGHVAEQTGRPTATDDAPEHTEHPGASAHAPEQPASPQPYTEAPGETPGEPTPEAHAEAVAPPQAAQEASRNAPGPGEAAEDAPEGADGADAPAEPSAGPEDADGETPDDSAAQDRSVVSHHPADTEGEASQDAPSAVPHEEHPLASYVLRVNGTDRPVTDAWIGESLLYVLRERLGLAGAKDGCSQGECGACNVQVDGRLVASCLVPAVTAAGSEVRTVEGLAEDGQPSDVQRALARCGAVQCGFCVPGMAMTVHDLLEGNPAPTELETRQALCGNLCRCSGYRGVVDAVQEVVAEREAHSAPADGDTDARIPHQAGPGAGGVNASAFGSPPEQHTPDLHDQSHDQPYGQDGGPA
ncbi:2Fe-2S iron-sulfur cluster-binding protein [Streptomyces coeruleorubidus]|uniref:2Fe-2S iron-sulfur cluster-binding protein n=1 Tax=Streptomyces coeruleorubidus TaxID=116188 RepID=UPI0033C786AA